MMEREARNNENYDLARDKYILFAFDFVVAIAAIRLVLIGYFALENYSILDYFIGFKMFILPVILIFDGIFTFLLTFSGCYGVLSEHHGSLIGFSLGVLACILFQIIGGIYSLYHRSFFKNPMRAALKSSITKYNNTVYDQVYHIWNGMQREFQCCGVDSPRDWAPIYSAFSKDGLPEPVPMSCCVHYEERLRKNERCYARLNDSSYQLGCYTQLQLAVQERFDWMLLSGIAPTLIQLIALVLTLIVAKAIKTDIARRKIRPWAKRY